MKILFEYGDVFIHESSEVMQTTLLLWLLLGGGLGWGFAAKAEVWGAFMMIEAQRLPCNDHGVKSLVPKSFVFHL
jgi:hypothetical protein